MSFEEFQSVGIGSFFLLMVRTILGWAFLQRILDTCIFGTGLLHLAVKPPLPVVVQVFCVLIVKAMKRMSVSQSHRAMAPSRSHCNVIRLLICPHSCDTTHRCAALEACDQHRRCHIGKLLFSCLEGPVFSPTYKHPLLYMPALSSG